MPSLLDREADMANLHPLMRGKAQAVLDACAAQSLPLRVFEAWRSPERQAHLFSQGRTRPGAIVTHAEPWESYHQYGLACDFVGHVNGQWTWDLPAPVWKKLHDIGRSAGLEKLGFEAPHLQVAGLSIGRLADGQYPAGGDASWSSHLAEAILRWRGSPPAPRLPAMGAVDKPPIATGGLAWKDAPKPGIGDWTSRFGGQEWRCDSRGVYLRADPTRPRRTAGNPLTCLAILEDYGADILNAAMRFAVAPELIVMTIATETAFARLQDFTGPRTFRWEPHVVVNDMTPPDTGDYSAGPMQTLASTARWVIRQQALPLDPNTVAPHFREQPQPPAQHPLYNGANNITIGTAEILQRLSITGDNPMLVSAAYNAGGLHASDQNAWRLRSSNDHLDRASEWYGDACFVLASLRVA